jgi:hypothetical protein
MTHRFKIINFYVQFFFRREQEEFRSRREQRILWGSGAAFQNSKTTNIFFN